MTRRRPLADLVRERILALAQRRGISDPDLGRRAGMDRSSGYQLRAGVTPTLQKLERYAELLGVEPHELLLPEGEEPEQRDLDEQDILYYWRALPPDERKELLGVAKGMALRHLSRRG